jgi:putative ABC transport system permease protein
MFEIVGVVADVKQEKLPGPSRPMLYQPDAQDPFAQLSLIVRTAVSPESIVPSLREKVRVLDKDLPLVDVKTLDEYVSDSLSQSRFQTILLGSFAGLALILTAVGLYGVISYSVSQRNHEIGVRLALGAQRGDILRLVVRQGLVLSLVGVGFGLIASFGVTRVMSTLLFEIRTTDPATFLVIPAVLIAVALAASYIPARKAMNVDPVLALRYE